MADFRLKKCIFIVNLFKDHRQLTRAEINTHLRESFPYDDPMSSRTFERYKEFIENNFPCKLTFDQHSKTYSIKKRKVSAENDEVFQYLSNAYDIIDSKNLLLKHRDKIHQTEIVTGTEKLGVILRAIEEKRGYTCNYQSFTNATVKRRTFIPLFLTAWEGRWYVVSEVTTHPESQPYTYALERISDIELTEDTMTPRSSLTIEEYFRDSYGIQHSNLSDKPYDIIIKAIGAEKGYIKARPIHSSQKIIEESSDSILISLHLVPCYNFYQQLLWHREGIEVIEPREVREEVAGIIKTLSNKYNVK